MPFSRRDGWDLLAVCRFVLASIVVLANFHSQSSSNRWLAALDLSPAYAAVVGFFLISGFSIGRSYSRNPEGYLRRRAIRILPLYVLAILYTLVISACRYPGHFTALLTSAVGNLLFLQTFICHPMTANIAIWSLPVEVTFYLITPWLARTRTSAILAVTTLSIFAYCLYPHLHLPFYSRLLFGGPLLCLGWAWMAGFIYQRFQRSDLSNMLLVITLMSLCASNTVWNTLGSPMILLGVFLALAAGPLVRIPLMVSKLCRALGDLSYPLYLFHLPTSMAIEMVLHTANFGFRLSISLAVASIFLLVDSDIRSRFASVTDPNRVSIKTFSPRRFQKLLLQRMRRLITVSPQKASVSRIGDAPLCD